MLLLCLWTGGGLIAATETPAQDLAIPAVTYPKLPKKAASAEGFVPAGWVLEQQASGDLNRDGIDDLAFVVRQNDSRNVIENSGLGESAFDTNPRILAAAFRNTASGDYALQLENHTLIPRRGNPSQEDPFEEGLAIERGGLHVTLRLFMTAGGWDMFTSTHKLQYRNGRFELVGFDRSNVHRASGKMTDISVNYLTGRMKKEIGHISSDGPEKVTWTTLERRAPLSIADIGDGLGFDPER